MITLIRIDKTQVLEGMEIVNTTKIKIRKIIELSNADFGSKESASMETNAVLYTVNNKTRMMTNITEN